MKIKKIKKPIISALEQRILFDGAAVATVVDVLDNSSFPSNETTATSNDVTSNNAENTVHEAQAVQGFERDRREVAFVDITVKDYQTLVDGVGEGVEVYLVSSLDDINSILKNEINIDAIHILSHGTTGEITVGNDVLNGNTLDDNALLLETMKNSLSENGDILLYGCNVASDGSGQEFINTLAEITQADVAASDDVTGSVTLGGDWDLEVSTGTIDTEFISVNAYKSELGTPSITNLNNRTYIEQSSPSIIDSSVTISNGISYDGKYIEYSITGSKSTETLALTNAANVNASGAISFVGSSVYLGNGSSTENIGSIDSTYNGLNGQKLRINFVSAFTNPSFETGAITGWTAMNQMINLGVTSIADFTSNDTSTYTDNQNSGGNDNDVPSSDSYNTQISTVTTSNGSYSLELSSSMTTLNGYDVVHGPAVYSNNFEASAGDIIYFDWRAYAGGDDFDAFGYIVNVTTGAQIEVLDATGGSNTEWTTKATTISTAGTYKFVFVNGTYDASGGKAAGGKLYIDNVRVFGNKVTDTVVSNISNQIAYSNSSDAPDATRTYNITAVNSSNLSSTASSTIYITAVNDAPTGLNKTITTNEDISKLLVSSDFGFSDVDGDSLSGIKITSLATKGTLEYFNGSIWQNVTSNQLITKANIDSGYLRFNPSLNENGANYASFGFKVNDGTVESVNTYTITYNVTATNDAPTLESTILTDYNSTTAVATIISPSLVLNDIDSATLSSATISISNGFVAGDILTFTNNNATTYGNITTSYNSSTGVLTLASSGNTATKAQFQSALQNVTYSSSASNLSDGSRTISWIVNDGAANSLTDTSTINVFSDFDNDGVKDSNDIDDDNDGILDINESTENFQWASAYSLSGNTATGTINGIGFTYTLTNNPSGTALNIQTNNMYQPTTFPSTYNIPTGTSIMNTVASTNIITFDSTILNPVLAFSSIGNSSTPVPIKFSDDVTVLWETATTANSGDVISSGTQITGTEGFMIVKLVGEYNQISFEYLANETYVTFAFGADVRQDVDTDNDGIVDRLDTDSDNDGVLDNVEAQVIGGFGISDPTTLAGYIAPLGTDVDMDGLNDAYDADTLSASKTLASVSNGLTPIDSNSNGTADYLVDEAPVLTIGTLASHDGTTTSSEIIAPALTLVDVENHNISEAKIQINNFVSGDTLSFANDGSTMGSITSSYNTSTGILTLSGTATIAQYEAALKSVEFSKTNSNTTDRSFSFTVGSAIPYSGNGHYYEVAYFTSGKTWDDAKTFAQTQTLYGMQGYLATITSADENAFILSKLPSDAWIGGSDAAVEGTWKWVTGPEDGQIMSYTNWNSGEPNNSGSNEDAAEFYASGSNPGKWNDLPSSSTTLQYAIIEYGGMTTDSTVPVISATATMIVNDAPTISVSTNPYAVDLDGTNDYLTTNSSILNDISKYTVSFWINPDSLTSNIPVRSLVGQNDAFEIFIKNGDTLTFWNSISGGVDYSLIGILSTGNWTHLAITGDSVKGEVKIYANGVLKTTLNHVTSTNYGNSTYNVTVGGYVQDSTNGGFFDGKLDEISIWNEVKTAEEISTLQTARLTGKESGLLAYWSMDEGTGNSVENKVSGSDVNTNLTLTNGTTWVNSTLNVITTYTEHDTPIIISPSVTIGDTDSSTIESATISISSNFVSGDTLSFTNDDSSKYGNITASYDSSTGVLTLSSSGSTATMQQWKDALENAKFSISSSTDVVNSATKTISWKVNDGSLDSLVDTSSVDVQGFGKMPYIYGTDKATVNEDSSVSLSGFSVGDDDTTILTVSIVSQHGNLSLGTTTGITGYSSATKTLEITGTSTDLQNALNSMVYTPDANYNGLDELVIKTSDDSGKSWSDYYVSRTGLFYNPTNQHYYEFVSTPLSWDAAKTAAESRTYLGLGGYLATVTSSAENALIASKLGGNGWMGASDATQTWTRADGTTFTTSEGNWTWISGPEAGTKFWQDETSELGKTESVQGYTVNGMYANFASGEPNNYGGDEDVAHFYSNNGTWNDYPNSMNLGYVVEYGGLSTDISSKPAAAKLEITVVSVNDLPVNNNVPSSVTTNEDTSIVFSSANSNAITITDIDATTVTTTLSIGSGKGTLNVVEGNGATITNNGTTTVQMTGTVAQVNAALDGLAYNPTSNANGNAYTTLKISTNDGFVTDLDSVIINITAVDDLPVANSMAATVGVGSAQLFSYFQPNFFDVDNDAPVAIKLNSAPDKGQFEHWNGTSWEIVSNITPSTPLIVAMSEMNDYRFNALSESNTSTTVQWQVKTAGDTSDTGWSNTATGTITILSYANNTTPSVSITYPTGTTTGTPSTQTVKAPDSSNPTSSVETITSNNVIPINEDTQTATITLTYSDSVTPAQFMQGIMTSSNTRLIDFSDPSTFVMTQSVVNNVGTITLILKPKADMYGDTLITLGAFDGQKTSQETFTLRVNSVNEQAIVDNFTKTIDEDTLFSFATINPADIYHDANDVNNNTNVTAVDYNSQMAIIQDAMMNPSDTAKQLAKASAITTLVDANYFPQSFIIDTLPTNGDLYLDGTKIVANNYVVAIADLEKLVYQPDSNYFGTDNFTWHALDKEGLASVIKTATFTVNPINDAPVITSPSTIQIVDTTGASINGTITNTLIANDVDNTNLTYKIDSGAGVFVETMVGTYGTLVINSTTGDYEFIPNQSAITALNSDTTETFTLNVSDGLLFDTTTLTINITAAPETASIYTEQADATLILTDTSINTQESYGGGSIEFDLNDPLLTETLDIQKVLNADITAGAVSIVGKAVYLGNGTTASVIGQIDSVYNGENGQKLKINFSVDFANGNFNSLNNSVGLLSSTTNDVVSIDGWNIVNGRVNLGVDTIAGLTTPQDTTNPGRVISATDKDGDILRRGTFYTYVNDDDSSFGDDNSIKLNSSLTSTNGYAIVRGPYIYSDSAVSLKVGDSVQFDWKAQGGADAYDVFGYIVDVNNPSNYQIILNQTGANARATTAWATVSTTIATDGEYKFVFVSGSWDATGGKALGAQLYIDDVKVTQSNPSSGLGSDVLEKIAQKVTYQNSSDLSASNGIINKTVTVTASSGDITPIVHSSTKALNIQEVNDSVTLVSSVSNIYYTDTDGVDNFSNTIGKLSATDADSATVFTYGIDSSTSNGDGTVTKVGSYGTLTLDSSTGEYTFTPDSDVINALSSNVNETFTFSVNDGSGSTDSKVLTINIESVNDAPLLGGVTSTPTFTENGTAVLVDPTITITDLEGTSYDSGYVAFRTSQNGQLADTLSILNVGGISVSGNNVNYGGVTTGTIDSIYDGQNGKELRINLNSNAYSSQVQALARAIAFSNPTDDLSSSARTIEIKINDGGNGGATTARYSIKEATVNIQTINDLAQINLGNESLVVEKSIFSNPNGDLNLGSMISFADLDGDTLTVVIETTNYGLINVNDSVSNGLNSSQISGNNSRVVTLTGTIEQINNTLAVINGASYTAGAGNDYITPGADYLKVTATDELGGVSTSQKLVMVLPAIPNAYSDNIIAKEDNNAIVDISSLTSDINDNAGTYIFGTGSADITDVNGNITSSGNITAFEPDKIVFSSYDIDGDNNPFTQSPIGYQLANGKLILDNDQILGTDFAKFTFIPNENWSGVETFVYQYTSGDAKVSNIAQVSIYVIALNDAPIVTVSNSETINEDSSIVFKNTNAITLADIDIVNPNQMLDLTLSVENGKLELAQNSGLTILEGNDNSSKIKVQGNLSNLQNAIDGLKYTSNQDYNGTDALIVKLNDNGNTGESGILESEQTINITINAVNDAPVFTSQVDDVVEGVIINGVLPASDVDSSSLAFSIEGNLPTGFVLNRDGSYTFDSSSYNHLGAGETQTIVVPVSVTDIEGLKTTANFSITIIGSNDSPDIQIVDVNANIVEGSVLSDTGSITFTDLDLTDRAVATEATKSVTAVSQDGVTPLVLTSIQQQDIEAAFTINNVNTNTNDGIVTWDYTIAEGKLDFLGEGEIVTAVFTITVTDDEGAADTQDVIVRIIGSNDSPDIQIVDVNANIVEGSVLSDTGSITFTDLDLTDRAVATEATKSVTAVSQDGVTPLVLTSIQQQDIEAAFTINNVNTNTNDGIVTWDYTIAEGKLDFLGEGEIVTAVFTITVTDDEGAADTQDVIVRIIGSNDSPDIQIVDVNANIVEGSVLSDTGSITFTDLDLTDRAVATEATKSVTAVSQDGVTPLVLTSIQQQDIEAAFTINNVNTNTNDGIVTWDYTIAEGKLDFLGEGEIVTAVFTITVTDDEGAADTQDVIVRIIGSNDSPIVSFENVNDSTPFGEAFTKNIASLFSDKDLTNVFTYEAINLPRGLVIDSKTGVISGAAIESGIFEIILIGKDSGNPSLSVSRTFSLLVIAPAQAETITVPTSSDTANTNSNTNNDITLNNFNDNGQNNVGVLNINSSDLASTDTGVGFLSNTANTNDGIVQNNELANNQTEEVTSNNTTITNSTNQATDSKGLVQANVDLNVLTNGQIVFNETNQDSFSIVGITIEEIRFENNNIEIKVVDTNLSQNFIVTQIDGSALPQGLSFNPRTGNIIGIIPEDLDKLEISIKAINLDGTTRILNLKLDLKELKKSQGNQADADEKYMGLKEQIALENQKLDDYGSYLTRLFA